MDEKRPDVVYVATESPMGASAVKAARTLEVPVVMGFHTNFHQYMKDYHFSRLETAAVNYLRKLHNRAGMTVVPTEEMRRTLEGWGLNAFPSWGAEWMPSCLIPPGGCFPAPVMGRLAG